MINVSQNWKEKLGNYNTPSRGYLTPEELIKIEYNIDGQTLTFTKNDIMNFTHTNNVDLNSLTLPKDEIKFEIRNDDNRWNPDNPQGLYNKITEKQKVDLYYGAMINGVAEWHKAGTFWMSSWDTPQNGLTASFTATSQLDFGTDKFGEVTYTDAPTYKDVCGAAASHMGLNPSTTYIWQKWNVGSTSSYSMAVDNTHLIPQDESRQILTDIPAVGNRQIYYSNLVPTLDTETGKLNFRINGFLESGDGFYTHHCCIAEPGHALLDIIKVSQTVYTDSSSMYINDDGTIEYLGVKSSWAPFLRYVEIISVPAKGDTLLGEVRSTNSSAYPQNGQQGDYWYVYNRQEEPNVIIDSVLNNYNVPYKSGTTYTVDMFKDTTDAQVIQYCANAAQCSIRYDVDGKIHIEPFDVGAELTDYQIDLFTSYKQPEYNMSKQIKNVIINNNLTAVLLESGENQQISNSLITNLLHANLYAGWLGRVINTRKEISGTYRCDPRLLPYDYIKVWSKYALNECFITSLTINYAGSFKADYTARVIKSINQADVYGLYYAGDKQRAGNSIS